MDMFNMNNGRYKGGRYEYSVESIGRGRKRGVMKSFATRTQAEDFARQEVQRGRGITISRLSDASQRDIVQKNMQVTALAKGKYGKSFAKDYGRLSMKKRQPRQQNPFGYNPWM
jgi:hypothetical protein